MKKVSVVLTIAWSVLAFVACERESENENLQEATTAQEFGDFQSILEKAIATTDVSKEAGPVRTVDFVDVDRYVGQWFELASVPETFSRDCKCTTAIYEKSEEGIKVINACVRGNTGVPDTINGRAEVVDSETNAKLNVFFGPTPSPYWVIDLVSFAEDTPYAFSVVSGPTRKSLFILSRNPRIESFAESSALFGILRNLILQGYDLRKLRVTNQDSNCVYPS